MWVVEEAVVRGIGSGKCVELNCALIHAAPARHHAEAFTDFSVQSRTIQKNSSTGLCRARVLASAIRKRLENPIPTPTSFTPHTTSSLRTDRRWTFRHISIKTYSTRQDTLLFDSWLRIFLLYMHGIGALDVWTRRDR